MAVESLDEFHEKLLPYPHRLLEPNIDCDSGLPPSAWRDLSVSEQDQLEKEQDEVELKRLKGRVRHILT